MAHHNALLATVVNLGLLGCCVALPVSPQYSAVTSGVAVALSAPGGGSKPLLAAYTAIASRRLYTLGCGPPDLGAWSSDATSRLLVVARGNCSWLAIASHALAANATAVLVLETAVSAYFPDEGSSQMRPATGADPCRLDCEAGGAWVAPGDMAQVLAGLPGSSCAAACDGRPCGLTDDAPRPSDSARRACCLVSRDLVAPPSAGIPVLYAGLQDSSRLLAAAWPLGPPFEGPAAISLSAGPPRGWVPASPGLPSPRTRYAVLTLRADALRALAPLVFCTLALAMAWAAHCHWQVGWCGGSDGGQGIPR